MKIVIFDREEIHRAGGLSTYNERLRRFLTKKGHQVFIFRYENKKSRLDYVLSLPYYWAERHALFFIPKKNTLSLISKGLKKINPDLVFYPMGITVFDLFIPSLCHNLSVPVVGIWHVDYSEGSFNPYVLFIKSVFRAYLNFCKQLDGLIVFSEKIKNFYATHGLAKNKIHVVANGIDVNFYKPGPSRFALKHKIKSGVLFLGRVTLQKNPEVLLKSFQQLGKGETKLVFVGEGDLRKTLQKQFPHPQIIFTGPITDEQKKLDVIRSCQVFVLPSLTEGISLALLEAMSCGLACVSSDAGNHGQILKNTGIVISVEKLRTELPVILRVLADHPEIAGLLGKKARKKVINFYNEERHLGRLEKIFLKTAFSSKKRLLTTWPAQEKNEAGLKDILVALAKKAKKFSADYLFSEDT